MRFSIITNNPSKLSNYNYHWCNIKQSLSISLIVNNKFYINSIFLLPFEMKDQKYALRLNQIREKYGHANNTNHQKQIRQADDATLSRSPLNFRNNNYEQNRTPQKKSIQQMTNIGPILKQKSFVAPSQITNSKEPYMNIKRQKFPNPEENFKHSIQNNHNNKGFIPHQANQNYSRNQINQSHQYSSPTKGFKNQNLASHKNYTITPLRINKENWKEPNPINSQINLSTFNNKQQNKRKSFVNPTRQNTQPPNPTGKHYAPSFQQPYNIKSSKTSSNNQGGIQMQYKCHFSISSIDKVQSKIQQALNKNKK